MPSAQAITALSALLCELFSHDELRRLVRWEQTEISNALPSGVGLGPLADALVDECLRRGELPWLMAKIAAERPGRADDIQKVQALLDAPAPEGTPKATRPAVHPAESRPADLLVRITGTTAQASWAGPPGIDSGPVDIGAPPPELRVALARFRAGTADTELVQLVADALTDTLFRPDILRVADAARQHPGVLVRLQAGDTAVVDEASSWRSYPWELLRDPSPPRPYLFADPTRTRIVREMPRAFAEPSPTVGQRLLLITASPSSLPPIDVAAEADAVARLWPAEDVVRLDLPKRRDLLDVLGGPGDPAFDVVHVACHGAPDALFLGERIDATIFGRLLANRVRSAVWLNACLGSAPGNTTRYASFGWDGVAGALIGQGVPHVLAHPVPVFDDDAILAAATWHKTWRATRDPYAATGHARHALRASTEEAFGTLTHLASAAP